MNHKVFLLLFIYLVYRGNRMNFNCAVCWARYHTMLHSADNFHNQPSSNSKGKRPRQHNPNYANLQHNQSSNCSSPIQQQIQDVTQIQIKILQIIRQILSRNPGRNANSNQNSAYNSLNSPRNIQTNFASSSQGSFRYNCDQHISPRFLIDSGSKGTLIFEKLFKDFFS